jgi:hypothetical protein
MTKGGEAMCDFLDAALKVAAILIALADLFVHVYSARKKN